MTYSTEISSEGINSQYLAVLKPRRIVSLWTNISGTKYSSSFDYGIIISLEQNGISLTEATSSALSDGIWYYDIDSEVLYFDNSINPSSYTIVVTYELYFGTFDAHHNRIPTNSATRTVYFEPLIVRSPTIRSTVSDAIFGFLPSQSSQLVLSNATHILEKHVYDSSFNFADIDIYHWIDVLSTDNCKLISTYYCKNIGYTKEEVTFNLLDQTSLFDQEYRNTASASFYTLSAYPNLDSLYKNSAIRQVYGVVDGFVPVNIDYVLDNPTTSDNRIWSCISDETDLGTITTSVPASPSSTTTRTYLASADGIRVGDTVFINGSVNDYYVIVIAVNKSGDDYIEHAANATAADVSSIVTRSFVGSVNILKEGILYTALYGRDYTEYTDATNSIAGFQFTTSLETNLSLPNNLAPTDIVFCRIYGHKKTGENSTETGNYCKAISILEDFLENVGVTVDTATFTALKSSITDEIGFSIPERANQEFPTYKNLILKITETILLKIFLDDNLTWSAAQTGPVGIYTKEIEEDEILDSSFSYGFDYSELLNKVIVSYAKREVSEKGSSEESFSTVTATSNNSEYLHKVEKQKTFNSLHFSSVSAQILADRLMFYFGDRLGKLSLATKNRFFDTELNHVIRVTRGNLPGLDSYRDFSVISSDKSLRQISLEIDDQKGIEDNSGSW